MTEKSDVCFCFHRNKNSKHEFMSHSVNVLHHLFYAWIDYESFCVLEFIYSYRSNWINHWTNSYLHVIIKSYKKMCKNSPSAVVKPEEGDLQCKTVSILFSRYKRNYDHTQSWKERRKNPVQQKNLTQRRSSQKK